MNKYFALINWINKVSVSSASISDIEDEYRLLYSNYMIAFKLHKMKYSSKSLGIFVTMADNFTSSLLRGKIFSAIHGLLDIRTVKVTLLEEERKLPGREIAYIYHADQKFGKK